MEAHTHESYSGSTFDTLNVEAAGVSTVMLEAAELEPEEWISLIEVSSYCYCCCVFAFFACGKASELRLAPSHILHAASPRNEVTLLVREASPKLRCDLQVLVFVTP